MHSFKEKFTATLNRLFADSPTASSDPSSPCAYHPEARPYSKGGKSSSSYFSFITPSLGTRGSRSGKDQYGFIPIEPQPDTFECKKFNSQDGLLDDYVACNGKSDKKETKNNQENDEFIDDEASRGSTSSSEVFEEATDQNSLLKPLPNLMDDSVFITPDLYEFLHSSIPNIVKGCKWALLYSTSKHGISLRTLIRKSGDLSGPCLLIVGDMQGAVFGGLLESPLKPTPKRKYQGTNQTFVFTTIYGEPRLFRPTGANRYYYLCLDDLLALGGGGNFALHLDGDLLNGTSGPCDTFGNMCLANSPEFELRNVELWGFTHASQYLT